MSDTKKRRLEERLAEDIPTAGIICSNNFELPSPPVFDIQAPFIIPNTEVIANNSGDSKNDESNATNQSVSKPPQNITVENALADLTDQNSENKLEADTSEEYEFQRNRSPSVKKIEDTEFVQPSSGTVVSILLLTQHCIFKCVF